MKCGLKKTKLPNHKLIDGVFLQFILIYSIVKISINVTHFQGI